MKQILRAAMLAMLMMVMGLGAQEVWFGGWDPVSWFEPGNGQKGTQKIVAEYKGKQVWFATEAHRKQFLAKPEKYLPEFGGYCAYSLTKGKLEKADPACFRKQNGKVYLFANEEAAKTWSKEMEQEDLVPSAASVFKKLLGGA